LQADRGTGMESGKAKPHALKFFRMNAVHHTEEPVRIRTAHGECPGNPYPWLGSSRPICRARSADAGKPRVEARSSAALASTGTARSYLPTLSGADGGLRTGETERSNVPGSPRIGGRWTQGHLLGQGLPSYWVPELHRGTASASGDACVADSVQGHHPCGHADTRVALAALASWLWRVRLGRVGRQSGRTGPTLLPRRRAGSV
jgi:hypothetical protein